MTFILDGKDNEDIKKAGLILKEGGLVAIPTETVYGLAANGLNEKSVKKIYEAKGRPSDNPLILHISDISQLQDLVMEIPENALRLAENFWPGPLTIIMKKSAIVPGIVSGGLDTVAVRLPASETARAVIRAAGTPLAAPSANISGRPSPTEFKHVYKDLNGRVDAIIDGGSCAVGVESTVISLTADIPVILRPGGITRQQLEEFIGHVELDPSIIKKPDEDLKPSSPGMKYTHYAPKARISVVDASPAEYIKYVNGTKSFAMCFDEDLPHIKNPAISYGTRYDGELQASRLFSALIKLDEKGADDVLAHIPSKAGIGLAVYNRLIRSSGFRTINPKGYHIIGLTGGSGTGKTTIANVMKELGCAAIDCDKITKSPQVYNDECIGLLKQEFGDEIAPDGVLNRRLLAKKALSTKEGRESLNRITHPRILNAIWEKINSSIKDGYKLIVVDAPTLFESGFDFYCSRIIAVTASDKTKLSRIMKRDGMTEQDAKSRLSAQQTDEFYTHRADHIINGEGGYDLKKRLLPIVNGLIKGLEKPHKI